MHALENDSSYLKITKTHFRQKVFTHLVKIEIILSDSNRTPQKTNSSAMELTF